MTREELLRILPHAAAKADVFAGPLRDAMAEFAIDTPARQAAFIAQVGHESSQLTAVEENFNYRPQAILNTFNTASRMRFTPQQAEEYGHTAEHPANQPMIANVA